MWQMPTGTRYQDSHYLLKSTFNPTSQYRLTTGHIRTFHSTLYSTDRQVHLISLHNIGLQVHYIPNTYTSFNTLQYGSTSTLDLASQYRFTSTLHTKHIHFIQHSTVRIDKYIWSRFTISVYKYTTYQTHTLHSTLYSTDRQVHLISLHNIGLQVHYIPNTYTSFNTLQYGSTSTLDLASQYRFTSTLHTKHIHFIQHSTVRIDKYIWSRFTISVYKYTTYQTHTLHSTLYSTDRQVHLISLHNIGLQVHYIPNTYTSFNTLQYGSTSTLDLASQYRFTSTLHTKHIHFIPHSTVRIDKYIWSRFTISVYKYTTYQTHTLHSTLYSTDRQVHLISLHNIGLQVHYIPNTYTSFNTLQYGSTSTFDLASQYRFTSTLHTKHIHFIQHFTVRIDKYFWSRFTISVYKYTTFQTHTLHSTLYSTDRQVLLISLHNIGLQVHYIPNTHTSFHTLQYGSTSTFDLTLQYRFTSTLQAKHAHYIPHSTVRIDKYIWSRFTISVYKYTTGQTCTLHSTLYSTDWQVHLISLHNIGLQVHYRSNTYTSFNTLQYGSTSTFDLASQYRFTSTLHTKHIHFIQHFTVRIDKYFWSSFTISVYKYTTFQTRTLHSILCNTDRQVHLISLYNIGLQVHYRPNTHTTFHTLQYGSTSTFDLASQYRFTSTLQVKHVHFIQHSTVRIDKYIWSHFTISVYKYTTCQTCTLHSTLYSTDWQVHLISLHNISLQVHYMSNMYTSFNTLQYGLTSTFDLASQYMVYKYTTGQTCTLHSTLYSTDRQVHLISLHNIGLQVHYRSNMYTSFNTLQYGSTSTFDHTSQYWFTSTLQVKHVHFIQHSTVRIDKYIWSHFTILVYKYTTGQTCTLHSTLYSTDRQVHLITLHNIGLQVHYRSNMYTSFNTLQYGSTSTFDLTSQYWFTSTLHAIHVHFIPYSAIRIDKYIWSRFTISVYKYTTGQTRTLRSTLYSTDRQVHLISLHNIGWQVHYMSNMYTSFNTLQYGSTSTFDLASQYRFTSTLQAIHVHFIPYSAIRIDKYIWSRFTISVYKYIWSRFTISVDKYTTCQTCTLHSTLYSTDR